MPSARVKKALERLGPGQAVLGSWVRLGANSCFLRVDSAHCSSASWRGAPVHSSHGHVLAMAAHFQGRQGVAVHEDEFGRAGRGTFAQITPGCGNGQVPPVQLDLSLWQALREDLRGKMVDLTKCATGSCSWVTQPIIQLQEAAASLTAKIMDIHCSERCLKF